MANPPLFLATLSLFVLAFCCGARAADSGDSRDLVELVRDAARTVESRGEPAFAMFRQEGSRWRKGERYVFVLDERGKMLVHPDPELEGNDAIDLKDINGKPIVRGLIEAATSDPHKPEGWYHYEWPVPGALLPRWKSSFVRLVSAPDGARYIVGSGTYTDRMERSFVVDAVRDAVALIEKKGEAAFAEFRDPKSRFIAKDTYVFVTDSRGVDLVHPAFPNLEGQDLADLTDTQGKKLIREMLKTVETGGSGWVDYMWPKPGESVSTRKSTFVSKARLGARWVMVGCGVYLSDAPKSARKAAEMTASQLMGLVRDGAAIFESRGEQALPEFRTKGSRWFRDGTYFFVWNLQGERIFHAADPSLEGRSGGDEKDVLGRPYGRMFLEIGRSASGEGWVHYMYPEPGKIFPVWKSVFLKRVVAPSGKQYLLGCGVYQMRMDRALITDLVNRAAERVARQGKEAFAELRDKKGPFRFMDSYVFVDSPDGTEIVNPGHPSLEGKNLIDLRDVKGKPVAREYITRAMREGEAWVEYFWYRPGENTVSKKRAYVRRVGVNGETYIVGSGIYED